jgi:hypothetical protein
LGRSIAFISIRWRAGIVTMAELRKYECPSYPKSLKQTPPKPLSRGRFLSALEFPDSVVGMRQYARQLEFAEESNSAVRDSLARRYCQAGRWLPKNTGGI